MGREAELAELTKVRKLSRTMGRMTVVTGRRRIGKTRLILESLKEQEFIYLFVARKDERLLCADFIHQIKDALDPPIYGEVVEFSAVFQLLVDTARERHLNLVIDEFQEFSRINPSVFSEVQRIWDLNKDGIRMNLILSGSVHSLMTKIFTHYEEPLFGRAQLRLHVKPFSLATMRAVMHSYATHATSADLFTLYTVTGGVPLYIEHFVDHGALTRESMLSEIFHPLSVFLEEGRFLLIQEFGKDHATYFSILSLIASGMTSRREIESVLQKPTGGYLTRLEKEYQLIGRRRPLFSKPGTQNIRYSIEDNFLRFWFRFVFRYDNLVESKNFPQLRRIVDRDLATYSGLLLEKLIRQQLIESQRYSVVGQFWQRNGENEIDLIAINEEEKTATIGEVKTQARNIDLKSLERKVQAIAQHLRGYAITFRGYSLEDVVI